MTRGGINALTKRQDLKFMGKILTIWNGLTTSQERQFFGTMIWTASVLRGTVSHHTGIDAANLPLINRLMNSIRPSIISSHCTLRNITSRLKTRLNPKLALLRIPSQKSKLIDPHHKDMIGFRSRKYHNRPIFKDKKYHLPKRRLIKEAHKFLPKSYKRFKLQPLKNES